MSRMRRVLLAVAAIGAGAAHADGDVIDRVYDPYVQPFERELEYGALHQRDGSAPDGLQWQHWAYGQGLGERWAGEIYAIGRPGGNTVDAVEVEVKHQLTEQGEYDVDWGVLLELERCFACNSWEASAVLLAARDWSRWTALVNVGLIYEWGSGIRSEAESRLAAQLRYRVTPLLEPGLELYAGEDTRALGPSLTGSARLGPGHGLRWNAAVVFGLNGAAADTTAKLHVEYEF